MPKQMLAITGEQTMLQQTVSRVESITSPQRVFVITNATYADLVREQLPDIPSLNVVGEPSGRDSAPAVAVMASILESVLGPDAVMVVLPADHAIEDEDTFREAVLLAARTAELGYLVTIGIVPDRPETGFGYVQHSGSVLIEENLQLRSVVVEHFKEKPDQETAKSYLEQGNYYWNAGMYISTVAGMRSLYKTHLPEYEAPLARIVEVYGTTDWDSVFPAEFARLQKISFDYAIAEKADKVAVVAADFGWNDVGSWSRLADLLKPAGEPEANAVVGNHIGLETTNSLVYSGHRTVVTLGVDGLVIVDTPDVLMICTMDRTEDIKKIVDTLREQGKHDLL
jgi:mannose-1-phosphate guanylyltransferase